MSNPPENHLVALYDDALSRYGDTPQGAMWPNAHDRQIRYDVMLDLITESPDRRVVLCDLGCGTGGLLARIRERGMFNIHYVGIDRSVKALQFALEKFPDAAFHELDVNAPGAQLGAVDCDYLVANGLFTIKNVASQEEMRIFLEATIRAVWPHVRKGIAFNVMSKIVDWERDDLFHVPMDDMARLLHGLAGRRVRMRADYGLYEYTCYAYRTDQSTTSSCEEKSQTAPGTETQVLRVLRPLLPKATTLLPYLERIDATRIYSNFGPLALEFEARLANHFGLEHGTVVSAGTGTSALVGAVLAIAGRAPADRPFALMPAFTFVATAVAAQQCGYMPYLADIDSSNWTLEPGKLLEHAQLDRIGVVIPVAPFGRPVLQAPWREFTDRTGIPVVIDGAASFEGIAADPEHFLGQIPVILSLHATKSLATGEGGCAVTTDIQLATSIGQALNFGFHFTRNSRGPSINGKMSEYHAAVGLAELDGWLQKKQSLRNVADRYQCQAIAAGLGDRLLTAPEICSSYVLFRCLDADEAKHMEEGLRRQRVEFRLWYGEGLQGQLYFAGCPSDDLGITKRVAPCLIGLPVAIDLTDMMIDRVIKGLCNGLADLRR